MTITDEAVAQLRSSAAAGDPQAALKLARLLCLTGTDPQGPDGNGHQTWPEERWLRAVVEARPDGIEALTLLAGRLAQQISYWEDVLAIGPDWADEEEDLETDPYFMPVCGEDWDTVRRRRREAEELYARIRAAGPLGDLESGLDWLGSLLGAPVQPGMGVLYSYYVLEDEGWSGSAHAYSAIVASDADEFRWGCDQYLARTDGGLGTLTLIVHEASAQVHSTDLRQHLAEEAVDWGSATLPDLSGRRLPAGLPVPGFYYGYSCRDE